MFKRASKTFLTGLLAILPIGLTFYLLFIIVDGTESLLKKGLRDSFHSPSSTSRGWASSSVSF